MPIVSAVGVAASSLHPGRKALSKAIEAAMSKAVLECTAAGITDPDKIRAAMLAARDRVKRDAGAL